MISDGPIGQLINVAFKVVERPLCSSIDNCLVRGAPRSGAQSHQTQPTETLRPPLLFRHGAITNQFASGF